MSQTFECPICGATVKNNALACPECGADERTGLHRSDEASASIYDGVELPDDDTFDYDEFAAREFGQPKPRNPRDIIVGIVAVLLILAFASVFIFAI